MKFSLVIFDDFCDGKVFLEEEVHESGEVGDVIWLDTIFEEGEDVGYILGGSEVVVRVFDSLSDGG